jgi:hemerythrin-like domain-containing protein
MAMTVMDRLHADHANMASLLDILDRELDIVEKAGNADFEIMRDVMEYLTRYSDRVHHPMEDLVYARLADRSTKARAELAEVPEQHERIAAESRSLLETVSMIADGGMTLRTDILAAGRRYVADLRRHMEMEERYLFPMAERTLDQEDLSEVARILDEQKDPVFGDVVEDDFKRLYQHIQEELQ